MAKSMNAQLSMWPLMTSEASPSATSSPASAAGGLRSVSRAGLTTDRSGQGLAPASPSVRPESAEALPTIATSGPTSIASSRSAALQSWLESRLPVATVSAGSTLYALTWKHRITPSGLSIFALRASAPRISDKGSGGSGWPTPTSTDAIKGGQVSVRPGMMGLSETVPLTGWPTPCVVEPGTEPEKVWARKQRLTEKTGVYRGNDCGLGSKVHLAGWPTPQTRDHFPAHSEEYIAAKKAEGHGMQNPNDHVQTAGWPTPCQQDGPNGGASQGADRLPGAAPLAGWPTASARDWKDTGKDLPPRADGTPRLDQLPRVTNLAGWPTPTSKEAAGGEYKDPDKAMARALGPHANDLRDFVQMTGWPTPNTPSGGRSVSIEKMDITGRTADGRKHTASLEHAVKFVGPARLTASGQMLTGSSAGMESGGQLDPSMSEWLMGYPPAWSECAPQPTKKRRG